MRIIVIAAGIALAPAQAFGQGRPAPPTGTEIAAAARTLTLDHAQTAGATMFGKPFRFTPARLQRLLEDGAIIGVLENGAEGDETRLPPGRYHLYTVRVAGQWRTYAETDGLIIREAIRTTVARTERPARPTFSTRGWCIQATMPVPQPRPRDFGAYITEVCF